MQFVPFELLVFRLVFEEETHCMGFRTHVLPRGRPREAIRQYVSGGFSLGIFNREKRDHEIQSSCGFLEQHGPIVLQYGRIVLETRRRQKVTFLFQ